jgi:UDP-N-acetylglucosamine--N-acetylmuramyl-(pentapeptide) pyrophosphoryl-undecaprenol N-acetylglucosamine transferase
MAGGTGGHVYPGLAVARRLRHEGMDVIWLGTRYGLEARVVPPAGIHMEYIRIKGLRGKGLLGYLLLPIRVAVAVAQTLAIFIRRRPDVALSMGGYVAGPGGIVAWLLRCPLVIHEANAVPGFTNRALSYVATRILTGFPGTLVQHTRVSHVGNPVREAIENLPAPAERLAGRSGPLRVLVLGGSQGARALNRIVADAYKRLAPENRPALRHQCGERWHDEARAAYGDAAGTVTLTAFIEDMAEAYSWADIVVCRAGAMTVAELAAAGVGAVLVPFPFATDDHQTWNARYLESREAAVVVPEPLFTVEKLQSIWHELGNRRDMVLRMAEHARECAVLHADQAVANVCKELAHA